MTWDGINRKLNSDLTPEPEDKIEPTATADPVESKAAATQKHITNTYLESKAKIEEACGGLRIRLREWGGGEEPVFEVVSTEFSNNFLGAARCQDALLSDGRVDCTSWRPTDKALVGVIGSKLRCDAEGDIFWGHYPIPRRSVLSQLSLNAPYDALYEAENLVKGDAASAESNEAIAVMGLSCREIVKDELLGRFSSLAIDFSCENGTPIWHLRPE